MKAKKKRIAIIVQCLHGGGMEHVAAQLSEMFWNAGYDVYIFLGASKKEKCYPYKGNIVVLPHTFLQDTSVWFKDILMMLYEAYQLKKFMRKEKIDIAVSFGPMKNLVNLLAGGKSKKILTIHSCISKREDMKGLYVNRLAFWSYNLADCVVAVSQWCKEDLIRNYGVKRTKVKVVYNPVEKTEDRVLPVEKENLVLIVGRLQDIKRQWHIIRAFGMVLEKVPDAKLVIAGKGENGRYLRKLCHEMKIEKNVVFKGFVNNMNTLYSRAKCVVFASESEAFPCSVVEAMSWGVPIVAADCPGGIREIIDRKKICPAKIEKAVMAEGGFLTPVLDGKKYGANDSLTKAERELANGIIHLLKKEEMQKEMAANCVQISSLFNIQKIENCWEHILSM